MKIKDFMTRDLTALTPTMTIKQAVSIMAKANYSGLPVINEERQVIGFLSEKDIIQILFPETISTTHDSIFVTDFSRILRQFGEVADKKVDDTMTYEPNIAYEEQDAEDVAEIMLREKLKILPVVRTDANILVGVVTRTELLKALFEEK